MASKPDPAGLDKASGAVFAVLAGGGAAWWQFAAHHTLTAIAFGIVAAIAGFAVGAVMKVAFRVQGATADWLYHFLGRTSARFEHRYRKHIMDGLRYVDLKGLTTIGPFTPELEEVFVDVSLVSRPPQQIGSGVLAEPVNDMSGRRALSDFIGREKPAVTAVVGGPGSGKTTLLRHAAWAACKSGTGRRGASRRNLPVLLYLRDHVGAIIADRNISVATLARSTLGDLRTSEPNDWFEQKLRDGECLILLDGLDEVARQSERLTIAAWAAAQVSHYSGNDFVITSRPQGYQTAPIDGADVVQVCGLTAAQTQTFIRDWYLAVERRSTGADGADIEARAVEGAEDLRRSLEKAPALRDLAVNPLLVTMIANVHRYRGALPGTRADLYSEICLVMLERRQNAKNLASELPAGKKELILRRVAYTMMKNRVRDLNHGDILAEIGRGLRWVTTSVAPDEFLSDVVSSGLIIERETEQYAFVHQTFQEYLAAARIRAEGPASVLADAVNDYWWKETTLLYAAHADAGPIIEACLKADTVPALALAFDCDEQGSAFAPELRARLYHLLESAMGSNCAPDRRQLIAGVILTRHLQDELRTTCGSRISANPVTDQIYRFFRADIKDAQPDDVPATQATSGPAVGHGFPEKFIQWANLVTGPQTTLRLPRKTELDELSARQPILPGSREGILYAVWTEPDANDGSSAGIWVPNNRRPRRIDSATLAAHLDRDLADALSTHLAILLLRSFNKVSRFSLPPGRDVALDGDIDHVLGHPLDHALALDNARERVRSLARGRRIADRANELISRYENPEIGGKSWYSGWPFDPDPDPATAFDLDHARTINRDLDRVLARTLEHTRISDLDQAVVLAIDLDRALDRVGVGLNREFDVALTMCIGRAMAKAVDDTLHAADSVDAWGVKFSGALARVAGVESDWALTTDTGALGETLTAAVRLLRERDAMRTRDTTEAPSWSETVSERLLDNALSVFDGREPATRDKASTIRIAALCLAGEAEGLRARDIGEMFRQVAGGVTLLEMAEEGEEPTLDVIMLAMD